MPLTVSLLTGRFSSLSRRGSTTIEALRTAFEGCLLRGLPKHLPLYLFFPGMADELQPLPATPAGRYRHYKGGEYEVVGVARHSETLEPLVIYRPLYNPVGLPADLWARPHAMFFGEVEVEIAGRPRRVPRFAPLPG
jgi:hypothetical protein